MIAAKTGAGWHGARDTRFIADPTGPACRKRYAPIYVYARGDMKRRELERRLRELGWKFLRAGGNHDVWTDGDRQEAVPRHREIHEILARAILRRARRR